MADKIRLSNLRRIRLNIRNKLTKQYKLYDLARRLFYKHENTYIRLLGDYQAIDYRLAEIDGRLQTVTIKSTTNKKTIVNFKKHFQKMSNDDKQKFLEELKK